MNIAESFLAIEKLLDSQTVEDELHKKEYQAIRMRIADIIHECQGITLHVNREEFYAKKHKEAVENERRTNTFPSEKKYD